MASKQDSPFSGLDKALLRSTQQKRHQPAERKTPAADRVPAESNDPLQKSPSVEAGPSRATTEDKQLSRKPESKIDILIDSYHDSKITLYHSDLIEAIRKAVKPRGKDVTILRLTEDEKHQLADIAHNYKRRGKRTSETQIHRIAVNFILQDYKANGEHSVLDRVIRALLA